MKKIFKRFSAVILTIAILVSALSFLPGAKAATSTSEAGIVNITSGYLNVRAAASTTSQILTTLQKDTYITLISLSGSWWKVEYASGSYGYVSASYIKKVSGTSTATVNATSLNVRSGAGTSYGIITQIPNGKIVIVLSASNAWSKILFNGTKIGYVSSQYLRSNNTSTTQSMTWPVPSSKKLNQYFVSGSHLGIDIAPVVRGVPGDAVVAAYGGTVVYSGALNGYGNVVYINSYYNGKYIQTRYAHLNSAPLVRVGSTVTAGQKIGVMGNSGTSSGVHLHFEVRIRSSSAECLANSASTPVNPLNYVS